MWAGAFGDSNESGHLPEILEGVDKNCRESEVSDAIYEEVVITADSGFPAYETCRGRVLPVSAG